MSRVANRCLSFFNLLRKIKNFLWLEEYQQAFNELKRYLNNLTLLARTKPRYKLQLYLATSSTTLNVVLIREEIGQQYMVYYVSQIILGPETKYSRAKQLMLSLVMVVRKL